MRKEEVPGLRRPTEQEHEIVERELIPQFRKEIKPPGKGPLIWAMIIACSLLLVVVRGNLDVSGIVGFLVLEGLMLYLYHSNKKMARKREELVREMEQRNYLVVPAWAEEIRAGWNESTVDRHGMTKVRLESGQFLKEKYVISYNFSIAAVQAGANKNVPVLMVYIPCRDYFRLVPREQAYSDKTT